MADTFERLAAALGDLVDAGRLMRGSEAADDYRGDESLTVEATVPAAVVVPRDTEEVSRILAVCGSEGIPVTGRGAGTGLSVRRCPPPTLVVSFEAMNAILEIDNDNHVAVVQPGIRLNELDEALAEHGLVYPVYPGEYSASLGGNINTNAGGMRAVKYGVTRHHVLGLEVVLAGGRAIRTGGKFVKSSSGYDLTQLVVGSEGTLGLVTEITLRLQPRLPHQSTVLAPFATLPEVTASVPRILDSGVGPLILEYIDLMTMAATKAHLGLELGIPAEVEASALAYLVVMLESTHEDRLEADTESLAVQLAELGAMDVYVLPPNSAAELIAAREQAFWVSKANNADDVVDIVVPRASVPRFMERIGAIAAEYEAFIAGCGHAGDGNVHLGVFTGGDDAKRDRILAEMFDSAAGMGGAISAEHGIGLAKREHFLHLEDPAKIELMRGIKSAFDPDGIMTPGTIF
ncbi:MAG: FAD-linked oxidase C-terminal domain-containing protein [Microthrixaceae bacterium]